MRFELPDCKRCCVCVPLRYGILIFGYLNLLFALFVLFMEAWLDSRKANSHTIFLFKGVGMYTHMWFPCLLYSMEVVFNIVLLVGAHKKNTTIIRVYYYYGISTTLAVFLCFIALRQYSPYQDWSYDPFEFSLALSGLALQCYLLLLIRTELNKLQYEGGPFRYVNPMAEVHVESLPPGTNLS